MYYKFSKPGKWEKGHVQNIGKHDITFNSLNSGGDNGYDIHGTFEGVGRSIKEKYDFWFLILLIKILNLQLLILIKYCMNLFIIC